MIRLGRRRKAVLAQTMILSRGIELTFPENGMEDNKKSHETKLVVKA